VQLNHLAGKPHIHPSPHLKYAKNGVRIFPQNISEFIVSKKKHSVIHISLTENHTPTKPINYYL
jgi:hypothetical protein